MTVKRLTKQSEQTLLKALNDIADLTNDGEHPNDAITKVASEMKIPHGQIHLVVNAYNTGKTTAQRRSSESLWDKVAEFPLADTSVILESMYPDRVKTASSVINETVVSSEYSMSPFWVANRDKAEKIAYGGQIWKEQDRVAPIPLEREDNSLKKAKTQVFHIEQGVKEARSRVSYVFDKAVALKNEIADYFKHAGALPYQEVRCNAIHLYGDPAKSLFDQIASEAPKIVKQASTNRLSRAVGPIYDKVKSCMELTDAYLILQEDFHTKEANAKLEVENILSPFDPAANRSQLDPVVAAIASGQHRQVNGSLSKTSAWSHVGNAAKDLTVGSAKGFGGHFSSDAGPQLPVTAHMANLLSPITGTPQTMVPGANLLSGGTRSLISGAGGEIAKKQLKDYMKPKKPEPDYEHEDQISDIGNQALLTDLMANDEVLRHHNPHEVLDAYSTLSSLAPRASKHKDILRQLLRDKMTTGGQTSMSELKTLTEIENALMKQEQPPKTDDKGDEPKL